MHRHATPIRSNVNIYAMGYDFLWSRESTGSFALGIGEDRHCACDDGFVGIPER